MKRRCLYCKKSIKKESLYSLFIEEDPLCIDCRKKMKGKISYTSFEGFPLISFYHYDDQSLYKSMLIQFKEAYDEALYPLFLYPYRLYLSLRYYSYTIIFVPSSSKTVKERGFKHLELMTDFLKNKRKRIEMIEPISQRGKSIKERKVMEKNFRLVDKIERNEKLLLVDDVLTTGASLRGCIGLLKPYTGNIQLLIIGSAKSANKVNKNRCNVLKYISEGD